jgi:DNA polymerase-3 subunit delta'
LSQLGNLKKILLKKYEDSNLASVYLTKYPEGTDPKIWARDFMSSITTLADHPDVLWVERTDSENDYKVDSPGIAALTKFLNFRAYELKKKFIFLNDAHLLSVIVSNKLLKIFEELPENFCLFLFAPQSQDLLPTVESRAIKILMPSENNKTDYDAVPTHYESAQELAASLKKSDDEYVEEKKFIENALNKALKMKNFQECSNLLDNLKHYGVSENFNNTKLSRLSLFFK